MPIIKNGYNFCSATQLVNFLIQEGKDLAGEVVIPEEDTGAQNYVPGTFTLSSDSETRAIFAVFEPNKHAEDEWGSITFSPSPDEVALDALGYVLSRKHLEL